MTRPFNPTELPPDQLRRLVEILTHFGRITTVPERQTFLQLSGLQSLEPHLHLSEPTYQFASELIRESQRVGSFTAWGEPAFYQLLGYLQNEVSGQPEAHEFLSGLRRATTPPVTRADMLQRPSLDFTGRTAEIERLTKALRQGRPVMISGMGGIGKSDLARKVAEGIRVEFPGPALQVELQPDNKPVTATELVGTLILALNPTTKLPDTLQERVSLLRPLIYGQQGILLLDNVAAYEQIQFLESFWQGWAILITSRVRWVIQGGKLERLEPMDSTDAETLVATLTENYERTLTEIEVKQVAEACQYHPLALHIASAYLGTFTHHTVTNYVEQVRTAPMSALVAPEYANLAHVLGLSIEHLYQTNPIVCERWHLLALMPDTFDMMLASALLGKLLGGELPHVKPLDEHTTKETLDTLLRLNLLENVPVFHTRDEVRYQLHNFLTDYALNHSSYGVANAVQDEAVQCHALILLRQGTQLNQLYLLGKPIEALAKFDAIWNHLHSSWRRLNQFENTTSNFVIEKFASWMIDLLDLRVTPRQLILYCDAALRIARTFNYRLNEAVHLGNLGTRYIRLGNYQMSISCYRQALDIEIELDEKDEMANTLCNLGNVYFLLNDIDNALSCFKHSLHITQETGNKRLMGNALGSLATVYLRRNEFSSAIDFAHQATKVFRDIHNRRDEGVAIGNMGNMYRGLEKIDQAILHYQQALEIAQELRDTTNEGVWSFNLALVYEQIKERKIAIDYALIALKAYKKNEDPDFEIVRTLLQEWGIENV